MRRRGLFPGATYIVRSVIGVKPSQNDHTPFWKRKRYNNKALTVKATVIRKQNERGYGLTKRYNYFTLLVLGGDDLV
jgi:hypothetical protein